MRLGTAPGDTLELSVVGYQFPEAKDPRQRFSWHVVQGRACTSGRAWAFRWPALTCDESARLPGWLSQVADALDADDSPTQPPLSTREAFIEPDLTFEVTALDDGHATLRVELDVELHAQPTPRALHPDGPTVLQLQVSAEQLRNAAAEWALDVERYPDALGEPY
jgi:hypothetical protein